MPVKTSFLDPLEQGQSLEKITKSHGTWQEKEILHDISYFELKMIFLCFQTLTSNIFLVVYFENAGKEMMKIKESFEGKKI
jgi:hypothetical protein